jgi:hypothetical protein
MTLMTVWVLLHSALSYMNPTISNGLHWVRSRFKTERTVHLPDTFEVVSDIQYISNDGTGLNCALNYKFLPDGAVHSEHESLIECDIGPESHKIAYFFYSSIRLVRPAPALHDWGQSPLQ